MSTIKVDTIATRTGSGNITVSNNTVLSGDLTVDTSTLKVDSTNNRVGIGVASPGIKLDVNNGGVGSIVTFTDGVATNFTFKTDGNQVGTFGTEAGSTHLGFMASGTERARIHSSGVMSVSNGIELGSGLDATTANVLDDYEEGTWTPTAGTNAGTINTAIGKYTKVGRVVYVVAYIESTGMSTSGSRTYGGLPFAVNNLASQTSVDYQGLEWSNNSGGGIYFDGGTSNFINNVTQTFRGSFAATDNSRFQGFYFTD